MGQEEFEQIERSHRFRHKRRGQQRLGIMLARIEQEQFDVDDADNVVRSIGINRHTPEALLFQLRDHIFVREIVRDGKRLDPWRHAILRCLVSQLDDFLDHLALGFLQRSFFLTNFDERL